MSATITEPTLKLSTEQLTQYRDEGYTVVRGLISRADIAAVRARVMDLFDGNYAGWPLRHFQVPDPSKHRNPKGGFLPTGIQEPAGQDETFRRVADHANLQSAMAQFLGGAVKRFTDQALTKHKDLNGQSFYHQDSYYWHLNPELGCNCWIALDEVGKDAIALGILPGTHKSWTLTPHEEYFDEPAYHSAANSVPFKRFRIPFDQIDFTKEVLLPMQPGDGAFFTNFTWHRAEPNGSGQHKCAYAIAYRRTE